MQTSRRSFIVGAACALITKPALAALADDCARVNASFQTGAVLVVNPLPLAFQVGDVITIDGVFALDRNGRKPEDHLRQFVVTAKAEKDMTSVFIYPSIVPRDGPDYRYATVTQLPMNRAAVRKYEIRTKAVPESASS